MTSRLPSNFSQVLADGLEALAWAEAVLDRRMAAGEETGPLLLAVRDVAGLAGRLGDVTGEEWEDGWMTVLLAPQDLAVLEEWETQSAAVAHSPLDPSPKESWRRPQQFRALRQLLAAYLERRPER